MCSSRTSLGSFFSILLHIFYLKYLTYFVPLLREAGWFECAGMGVAGPSGDDEATGPNPNGGRAPVQSRRLVAVAVFKHRSHTIAQILRSLDHCFAQQLGTNKLYSLPHIVSQTAHSSRLRTPNYIIIFSFKNGLKISSKIYGSHYLHCLPGTVLLVAHFVVLCTFGGVVI